jgi:hypothetical protein
LKFAAKIRGRVVKTSKMRKMEALMPLYVSDQTEADKACNKSPVFPAVLHGCPLPLSLLCQ